MQSKKGYNLHVAAQKTALHWPCVLVLYFCEASIIAGMFGCAVIASEQSVF
jgi:hypothetical protein